MPGRAGNLVRCEGPLQRSFPVTFKPITAKINDLPPEKQPIVSCVKYSTIGKFLAAGAGQRNGEIKPPGNCPDLAARWDRRLIAAESPSGRNCRV